MEGDFFVMLTTQSGGYTPLMDKDGDEIAKFETAELAKECAEDNPFGKNFGYEVFERGYGA
jgi:hypothetical protein